MTTKEFEDDFAFPLKDFSPGMTLRDYFAAKAMHGYITGGDHVYSHDIAEKSYEIAEIMIEERRSQALIDMADNANDIAGIPTFECQHVGDQFIFLCEHCNEEHVHGAIEGHRSSHCPAYSPRGYFLKKAKSKE